MISEIGKVTLLTQGLGGDYLENPADECIPGVALRDQDPFEPNVPCDP